MVSTVTKTLMAAVVLSAIFLTVTRTTYGDQVIHVGSKDPTTSVPLDRISHSSWTVLLSRYVNEKGSVAYASWKQSDADRRQLSDYLKQLSSADLDAPSSPDDRMAFWINAYNALTIDGVLQHYPIKSIRNLASDSGGFNIWDDYQLYVDGKPYSLNQIEHEMLRPMADSRIHFAIVCASKSCPALASEAYSGEKLDRQLSADAKRFFEQPQNFVRGSDSVSVSAILHWYREDFGDTEVEMIHHITPWLKPEYRTSIRRSEQPIEILEYDWSLNDSGF